MKTNATQATLDVDRLSLPPGGGRRLELLVEPGRIEVGGVSYEPAESPLDAQLEVSRTLTGYAFHFRFAAELSGPCVSCLEPAQQRIEVDAREVHQTDAVDEELESPYVEEAILRLGDWARDALLLAMPERFLCRPDCAGLCPVCGESLNDASPEEHRHETVPDPRWEKLRELKPE